MHLDYFFYKSVALYNEIRDKNPVWFWLVRVMRKVFNSLSHSTQTSCQELFINTYSVSNHDIETVNETRKETIAPLLRRLFVSGFGLTHSLYIAGTCRICLN